MGKEIENHVTRMDLDSSGFLKGSQEVLKAIEKLESALAFKGVSKGVGNVASALSSISSAAMKTAGAATAALVSIGDAAEKMSSAIDGASASVAEALSAVSDSSMQASESGEASAARFAEAFETAMNDIQSASKELVPALEEIASSSEKLSEAIKASSGEGVNDLMDISSTAVSVQNDVSANMDHMIYAVNELADNISAASKVSVTALTDMGEAAQKTVSDTAQAIGSDPEALDSVSSAAKKAESDVKKSAEESEKSANESFKKIGAAAGVAATLVGSAALFAYKKWGDQFPEYLKRIGESLKTAFEPAKQAVDNVIGHIVAKIDFIKGAIHGVEEALKLAFPNTMVVIGEQLHEILDGIVNDWTHMKNVVSGKGDDSADSAKKTAEATKDIADAADKAAKAVKDVAEGEQDAAENAENAKQETTGIFENLKNVGTAAKGLATDTVGVAGTVKGLSTVITKLATGDIPGAAAAAADFGKSMAGALKTDNLDNTAKSVKTLSNAFTALFGDEDKAKQSLSGVRAVLAAFSKDIGNLPKNIDAVGGKSKLVGKILEETMKVGKDGAKEFLKALVGIPGAQSAAGLAASLALRKVRQELMATLRGGKDVEDQTNLVSAAVKTAGTAVETVTGKFSALGAIAFGALERIGQKAVDTGERLIKSLSVDQITAGWNEYGLKIDSTQTIMASTGESLSTVNGYLEELNKYADKTIYSFSDMTANIGKFTNAGVDLDTAVAAIKGISNEAALSGANAQEASRAMYNFAQAISAGSVKLIDWKSIENANMATKGFKEELIKTAVELGTVKQKGDDYISVTKDANGHTADAFNATKNFNNSLSAQWMTTKVLTQTLAKYSDENSDLGKKAYAAAQDIKTGKQLLDTMQEAVGSGWSRTFELIIGDFNEAKKSWTGVNNLISPILDGISNARNGLLQGWRALGGREELLGSLEDGFTNLIDILKAAKEGFETFMPPITAERIKDITGKLSELIGKFKLSEEQMAKVKDIFTNIGKGAKSAKDALGKIGEKISELFGSSSVIGKMRETISSLFGQKDIFSKDGALGAILSLVKAVNGVKSKALESVVSVLGDLIKKANGSHSFGVLTSLGDVISNVVSLLGDLTVHVVSIIQGLGEVLAPILETLKSHLPDIFSLVNSVVDLVKGAVDVLAELIQKYISDWKTILPPIADIVMNVAKVILDVVAKLTSSLGKFFSEHAEAVAGFIKTFIAIKGIVAVAVPIAKVGLAIAAFIKKIKMLIYTLKAVHAIVKFIGVGTALKNLATSLISAITPAGAVALAIGAVVAAIAGLVAITKKAQQKERERIETLYGLSEAHKELNERVEEEAEAYKESQEERSASLEKVDSEFDYYQRLADELKTLVDENGKVKDGYESRVNFIISILNEQLGTEMSVVDGIISGYDTELAKIDQLIAKKRTLARLNAAEEHYSAAIGNEKKDRQAYVDTSAEMHQAEADLSLAKNVYAEIERLQKSVGPDQYVAQLSKFSEATQEFLKQSGLVSGNAVDLDSALHGMGGLDEIIEQETSDLNKATEEYYKASNTYFGDLATIANYEALKQAEMEYESAELKKDAAGMEAATKKIDQASAKLYANFQTADNATKDILQQQVADYEQTYNNLVSAFNKNQDGITKEMVDEAKWLLDEANKELDAKNRTITGGTDTSAEKERGAAGPRAYAEGAEEEGPKAKQRVENVVKDIDKAVFQTAEECMAEEAAHTQRELEHFNNIVDSALGKTGEGGVKSFTDTFGGVDSAITKKKDAVALAAKNLGLESAKGVESTKDANENASENVSSAIPEAADKTGLRSEMKTVGYFGGMGLVLGLERAKSSVIASAKSLASVIPKATAQTLQEKSPSKIAEEQGGFWGEGLVVGMENLEKAVKRESMTLSETMIDGTSAPLSSLSDILNSEFDDSLTITPVLDLSQIQNGAGTLRGMIDGVSGIQIGAADVSGIVPNRFGERSSGDPTLAELQGLRADMARFNERLGRLQVRMNSGALVGELIDPIDEELGYRAAIGQRG